MEEIVAPDFGESVFEASVGRWFKTEGETVQIGEPIVELHTDKAVQEINAVRDGKIGALLKQIDDVVRPGEALCEFQSESALDVIGTPVESESSDDRAASVDQISVIDLDEADVNEEIVATPDEPAEDDGFVEIQFSPFAVTPISETTVVATAEEEIDEPESQLVVVEDATSETAKEEPVSVADGSETSVVADIDENDVSSSQSPVDPQVSELRRIVDEKPVRRERLSRRRLTTARRMAQVQAEAVMTTTYNEVDMHEAIRIRQEFGEQFMASNGVKLGFMSFFVKAVLNGLKSYPILNAELDGDELVYKEYYDIGVAVASDHGLVVPVVRNADQKSFAEIENEIRGFAEKSRTGSFSLADLVGGTFTITNGGVFGSMMSTPILNPPQVGILGMHNIVDRAVVVDGEIAIRPMMYLAVTYDHRVVEGAQAVRFLMRIKQSLETAELLMLGG